MSSTPTNFTLGRHIAVFTFASNIIFQSVNLLSEPPRFNISYAPHPYFIIGFFVSQVIWNIFWLSDIYAVEDSPEPRPRLTRCISYDSESARQAVPLHQKFGDSVGPGWQATQLRYIPVYAISNLCLGGFRQSFSSDHLKLTLRH